MSARLPAFRQAPWRGTEATGATAAGNVRLRERIYAPRIIAGALLANPFYAAPGQWRIAGVSARAFAAVDCGRRQGRNRLALKRAGVSKRIPGARSESERARQRVSNSNEAGFYARWPPAFYPEPFGA